MELRAPGIETTTRQGCLTRREITLFSPPSLYVSLWSYGPLDGGLPQRSLRPSQGSRQVPHVATASPEALVEHDGGFFVVGHAREPSVQNQTPKHVYAAFQSLKQIEILN